MFRNRPHLRSLTAILVAGCLLLAGLLHGASAGARGVWAHGDLCVAGSGSTPGRSDGGGHDVHCVLCLTHAVGDAAPPPQVRGMPRVTPGHASAVEGAPRRQVIAARWRVPPPRAPPPTPVSV